jgi:hypothetical protein
MKHEDMLKHLGLSKDQLRTLLRKFHDFHNSLDAEQKAVVDRSLPSLKQASDSFGPQTNESELHKLLGEHHEGKPVMCFFPLVQHRNK